ncbi:MAG: RNA-dependent RNA polymerase [Sanya Iflavirus 4]|nr:MAG: RNA-dependent RNA polymerase [Sanya Iflavirus 4]
MCYNEITTSTYDTPAVSPKDERFTDETRFSPLVEALKYHGHQTLDLPLDSLDIAFNYLNQRILTTVKPMRHNIGILSVMQGIDGLPLLPGYESLEMDTSEGFPLINSRPKNVHNKSWLFIRKLTSDGYVTTSVHPLLEKLIHDNMTKRYSRIVPETIFTDCLKDAKLPKEKCLAPGKVRVFSTSPIEYTIAVRRFFMDFSAAYQSTRFAIGSAIGVDMTGLEVDYMVKLMKEKSNIYITGDYSKFGPTLNLQCVLRAFDIMINWYNKHGKPDPLSSMVRRILAYESAQSMHLALNLVYTVINGSPSGSPLTVIINDLVNKLYLYTAWIELNKKFNTGLTIQDYSLHATELTYGDDLWVNISHKVKDVFNNETLSEFFSEFKIKFTDAVKSGRMIPYSKLTDETCSFLKRTFHIHDKYSNVYVARLEERSLLETCNWRWNTSHDAIEGTRLACLAMLENAYQYGEEYYNNLLERTLDWFVEKSIPFNAPSYKEMTLRIYKF